MKTIRLLVLCLCLSLVSYSVSAKGIDPQILQMIANLDRNIANLESLQDKATEQQKKDLKFLKEQREQLCIAAVTTNIDRKTFEIQLITYKFYAHEVGFWEYAKIFKDLGKNSNYQIEAYALFKNKKLELQQAIPRYDTEKEEVKANLRKKILEETGIRLGNINLNPDPNRSKNDFSEWAKKTAEDKKLEPITSEKMQTVQKLYDQAVEDHQRLEKEQQNAISEDQNAKWQLDELLKRCPVCEKEYRKQFPKK